jgi:hypothetical protein
MGRHPELVTRRVMKIVAKVEFRQGKRPIKTVHAGCWIIYTTTEEV